MTSHEAAKMLASQEPEQRYAALDRLYSATPPEVIPLLLDLLKHPDATTVGKTMAVLDEYGLDEELTSSQFLHLLHTSDPSIRSAAFSVIKNITWKNLSILQVLIPAVLDPDPLIRYLVIDLLKSVDQKISDHFLEVRSHSVWFWQQAINAHDPGARQRAILALGAYGREGVALLAPLLQAPQPGTRQLAIIALARIGTPAVADLGTALHDADPLVREDAAWALSHGGAGAVAWLLLALEDKVYAVRAAALKSLTTLGEAIVRAIPAICACLHDPDRTVQHAALAALEGNARHLGTLADMVVQALAEMSGMVRAHPAFAGCHGSKPARPEDFVPLLRALQDRDRLVRLAASVRLGSAPPSSWEAAVVLDNLEMVAANPPIDNYLRENILAWLPRTNPQVVRSLPFVLEYGLRGFDSGLRERAERWLLSLENPGVSVVPALMEFLLSTDEELQRAAIQALELLGPKAAAAVEVLADFLNHRNAGLRLAAALALTQIDSTLPSPVPVLVDNLQDRWPDIRRLAEKGLGRLQGVAQETATRLLAPKAEIKPE